jgi:hypothetical protein
LQQAPLPHAHGWFQRLTHLGKIAAGPQAARNETGIRAAMFKPNAAQPA